MAISDIVTPKPPAKDRGAAARARRYRRRKKQLAVTVAAPSSVTPNVTPRVTQTVTVQPPAEPEIIVEYQQQPHGLAVTLLAVACGIALLGIAINIQTGWRFGTTPIAAVTFAGLSVAADALALALPSAALALWWRSRRLLALGAWATWIVALSLAGLASVGFVNLHIGDSTAVRSAIIGTASALTGQRSDSIAVAQQAVAAATQAREAECAVRGSRCRALEHDEQMRLSELSAALASPLPSVATVADADPQLTGAVRLAGWAGLAVTTDDLGKLRLALMALLPNLAGLVLCFGMALRR